LNGAIKTIELLKALRYELEKQIVPASAEELSQRLDPLSIGLSHQWPVVGPDTRMFRIRSIVDKPVSTNDVREPPLDLSPIGRLNERGQSVLYLADSPDTAFAERGACAGDYVLSEWRVSAEKLAMANGGIPPTMLSERLPHEATDRNLKFFPKEGAEEIQKFFREIYTLDVGKNLFLYRWSIACGLVNGFSHKCDREDAGETPEGLTRWDGRCPLSAIAYPSVRTDKKSLNFAFNDRGRLHVKLDHVQWVHRFEDGSHTSLDFANSWDRENVIHWQNRPAQFQLKAGEKAKIIKIAETVWRYETEDGSIPWFG
jgi:hypothetical protein